jgi:ATP-dependent Lon protease
MNEKKNDIEFEEEFYDGALVKSGDLIPTVIHLLPVTSRPFFPGQAVPLMMEEHHWGPTFASMVEKSSHFLGIVLADAESAETAQPKDFRRIGVVGHIHRIQQIEDRLQVLVEMVQRFEIKKVVTDGSPFMVQVDYLPEPTDKSNSEIKAYALAIINTIKELLPLNPLYAEELRMFLDRFGPEDPSHLADFAASLTSSSKKQLQGVLEAVELLPRMEKVLVLLHNELEMARTQDEIRQSVERRINKEQRNFFLKEQLI